jgi:hypothetical protein
MTHDRGLLNPLAAVLATRSVMSQATSDPVDGSFKNVITNYPFPPFFQYSSTLLQIR